MVGWVKIALGLICFAIGAASLIGAISGLLFVSASDAHIPAMFGAFGAMFLWFAYLLFATGALAQPLIQIDGCCARGDDK